MELKLQASFKTLFFALFFLASLNTAQAQFRDTTTYDYNQNTGSCQICNSGYSCFTFDQQMLIDKNAPGRLTHIRVKIFHTSCGSGNFYAILNGDTLGVFSPPYTCQCGNCTIDTIDVDLSGLGAYVYNDTNFMVFRGIQLCTDRIQVIRTYTGTALNDAAVLSVDSPYRACAGARNVVVTIGNFGRNKIDSVKVNWSWNGVLQTRVRYNTVLDTLGGSGASKARVVLGIKTLVANKRDTLKVWTSLPNNTADTSNRNDTQLVIIKPSVGGTVTVGGSSPTYGSIQAAINDMQANGICGPVIVDIRPGSYNEQLVIGPIPGADSTNTVTFRSSTGDSSDVSIYYSSFLSNLNYTVLLKDARHIHFSKVTLEGLGASYGRVVEIQGQFLDLSFRNCWIEGYSSSSTSSNHALMMYNSSSSAASRKILIDRCHFQSGAIGFYWTNSGTFNDLKITNSNFINQYYTNLFIYYYNNILVHNNTLSRNSSSYTSGYGIYVYNNRNITLTNNRIIQGNGANGAIYTDNVNRNGTFRNLVANNFISAGRNSGIPSYAWYSYYSNYVDFYSNSTYSQSTSSGYSSIYAYYGSSLRIRHNSIVQNASSGYLIYMTYSGTRNIEACNRNNFHAPNPQFYYNNNLAGLSSWIAATNLDSLSKSGNPNYKSATDLHAYSSDLNKGALPDSRITTDIDGQTRNSTNPDIGADEFNLVSVDAGISAILPYKADSVCVQAILKNHGANNLTSAQIAWSINGTAKTTYSWSGSLASGDTAIICLGKHKFINNTSYTVKVWSSSPNSQADTMNFNDTARRIAKPALSGIYTIGGSSPDFATFTAAVTAMTGGGIIDSVLFKVRNGTYNERIEIGAIPGAFRKNAIVFESQNKDSSLVTLSFATNFSFLEVVLLNSANWVTFRHMTIRSTTSSSPTRAVTLSNGASNIEFYHNHFEAVSNTSTDNYYNSLIYNSNQGTNINFTGNRFRNGASAMYTSDNTSLNMTGNLFENAYWAGVYIDYSTNLKFIRNKVISNSGYTGFYNFYVYRLYGSNIISHNIITGPAKNEAAAVYMQYFYPSNNTDSNYFFNNFIDAGGSNSPYALYIYDAEKTHFAHNNIHMHGTRTNNRAARIQYFYYSQMYNNVFVNSSVNSNTGMSLQLENTYFGNNDHNNYNSTGNYLAEINFSSYTDLASMQADGIDLNSRAVDPNFISNTNLHVQNIVLNGKAKKLHFVKDDIEGESRHATTPDIGADEFIPVTRDAGVTAFISPGNSVRTGPVPIKVAIANRGLDTLHSVRVHCRINSDTFATITINDTLASGDTVHVTVGTYTFRRDSINNLTAWTTLPNNLADQKKSNDTFRIKNKRTAMSGVYTIGGSSPDFPGFRAAIKALTEAGISDSVRFRVRSGTYTEQLRIPVIEGALVRNAIIFESSNLDSTSVTLRYNSTFSDTNYVVFFNGSSNITFRHMSITPLNTNYGTAFLFENSASYNSISHNYIKSAGNSTTSSSMSLIASMNGNMPENYNEIDNNLIEGGSYGVYMYGYGPPNYREEGLKVINNYFKNQFYTGLYFVYQQGAIIHNNKFTSTSTYTDYYGMRGNTLYGRTRITSNNIRRSSNGRYGIYLGDVNGGSDTTLVANNMVYLGATFTSYGMYIVSGNRCHIVNNTVQLSSGTPSGSMCLYIDGGSNNQVHNNILESSGAGYAYYVWSTSNVSRSDRNNLRTNGTYLAYWGGTQYNTLAALKSGSGKDASSLKVDPMFLGAENLHIKQIDLNETGLKYPGITRDIDGDDRDSIPDIGADEFNPPPLDAGIADIIIPKTPFPADSQFVKVVFKNFGLNTISTVNIDWTFNGVAQTTINWSGSLGSNDTMHLRLAEKYFDPDSAYNIRVWTSLPNSYNDTVNTNDTSKALKQYPALSGPYTIGGASPDFNTFTDAIEAMKRGGIINNVIFNVRNGTYTEQLSIPAIIGAVERNDIIFQSENKDSSLAILSYQGNSSFNFTVQLNGSTGVTFRHMTINGTDGTYGTVFDMRNGASYTTISNNIIEGPSTGSTGTNMSLVNIDANGRNNDFNHFTKNHFINGSMGIYSYGYNNGNYDRNMMVKDNKFEGHNYMGLYIQYNDTVTYTGNRISLSGYQYSFGFYCYGLRGNMNISGNNIILGKGYMGMYLYSCVAGSAKKSLVSNNMISILETGAYDVYGIYQSSCSYINFYNNNIRVASSYSSSYAIHHSSGNNMQSVNNVFHHNGSGYAFYTNSTSTVVTSDNNCYYSNGILAYWNGDRTSLSALKSANSKDAGSVSVDPFFISASDLHVRAIDLNKAGKPLTEVPRDIDGTQRDNLKPDIGADEFEIPSPDDAGITGYAGPFAPFASGSRPVKVIITNFGSDTLKSATVHWTMNGVSQTGYSWTGNLRSGAFDTVTVGNYSFTAGINYTLRTWPVSPNGKTDTLNYNDTFRRINIYSGLKGTYTIGGSFPDFNTFTEARDALMLGGVLDTVRFKVRNGTYNEQVQLLPYPGTAASKPVTFTSESGDSTKVILEFDASSGINHVFSIKGADYITLSHMTIRSLNYYYGNVVSIDNGAIGTTVRNNRLIVSNNYYYSGVSVLSGSDRDDNTRILNNVMAGGYYGVQLYGGGSSTTQQETGVVIEGNVMTDIRSSGIYLVYMNAAVVRRNNVSFAANSGDFLVYTAETSNDMVISHNKLFGNYIYNQGISINNHQGISTKKGMIFNNFISLKDPYHAGLYINQSNYVSVYYNSIHNYGTSYNTTATCVRLQNANNVDMRNNILSSKAGTYAIYGNNVPAVSNYNDLYTNGTNVGHVAGNNYASFANWKSGTSRDANSVSVNPNFFSDIDLHTTLINLDSAATPISGITDDIDRNTRNTTRPDIGADEFNSLPNNLAITSIVNPVSGCDIDSQLLTVTVFNYGSNQQKNFSVRYRINGGSIISQTFTDSVAGGVNKQFTFAGKVNTASHANYDFQIWTDLSTEQFRQNDTLKTRVINYAVPDSVGIMIPDDSIKNLDFPFSLSWSPSAGATLYDIYLWPDSVSTRPSTAAFNGLTQISKQITGNLGYGVTYKWQVIARNPSCQTPGPVQRFTIRELPDLLVSSVTAPGTAFSGNNISVSWIVKNNGTGSTGSTGWYDLVYLSTDKIWDGGDQLMTGSANPIALNPSQSYNQSATISLPNGTSGKLYVIIRTDGYSQLIETSEGNNIRNDSAGTTVTLTPPPDLRVTSIIKPGTVFSGQTINVRYTVRNFGTGGTRASSWRDFVYLNSDSVTGGTHTNNILHTGSLDPDSSYVVNTSFVLPLNISGGYYINVYTDAQNHVYEHASENNNERISDSMKVILTPPPDLIVRNVDARDTVSNRETLNVKYELINQGGSATNSTWYDNIYISKFKPFNAGTSTLLGSYGRAGIASDDTQHLSENVAVPSNINGAYYIYILSDAANSQFEGSKDTNNVSAPAAIRVESADLIVTSVTIPSTDTSGTEINVEWTVKNNGEGKVVSFNREDKIYLSRHNIFHADSVTLLEGLTYFTALNPGDSSLKAKMVRLPNGIYGNRYIFVKTDFTDQIYENLRENNNTKRSNTINVKLAPYPDLRTILVTTPDSAEAGFSMSLSYKVENKGNRNAVPVWKDRVYISKDSIYNPAKLTQLQTNTIGNILDRDSAYTHIQNLLLPSNLSAGNYYIYVQTDVINNLYEYLFENNNVKRSKKMFVKGYPPVDLAVTSAGIPGSAFSGTNANFSWSVMNKGLARTGANTWVDRIYLSSDSVFDGSDKALGEVQVSVPVDPDSSYSRNLSATIPNGMSGDFFVFFRTDYMDDNNDDDTLNNIRLARSSNGDAKKLKIFLSLSPDLQITAWNVPSTGTAGQKVKFSWKVENKGDTATRSGSWTDRVYLSTDYVLDNNDINLGNTSRTSNLAKNAFYNDTVEFFLPPNITGNFIVLIRTDDADREYEHNGEGNNMQASVITIKIAPPGDLIVTSVVSPDSIAAGSSIQVSYRIRNRGSNPVNGYRTDNLYISSDTILDANDVLIASQGEVFSLVTNANRDMTIRGSASGIAAGPYYFIVYVDVQNNISESRDTNNTGYSNISEIRIPELPLNVLTPDTMDNGEQVYYRIVIPDSLDGESILVTMKGDSVNGNNELYIRFGDVPSRAEFDFSYSIPFFGNQELMIPEASAGTYYLMAYGSTTGGSRQNIRLLARKLDFEIRRVSPTLGGNTGQVTLKIEGSKFDRNTVFYLELDSASRGATPPGYIIMAAPTDSLYLVDPTLAYVTFQLQGHLMGRYHVRGVKTGDTASLLKGFTIDLGLPADLQINVIRPANTRANAIISLEVFYTNSGTNDIVNSSLEIISTAGAPIAFNVEDLGDNATTLMIPLEETGAPPGKLRPKGSGSIIIYTYATAALGFNIILPEIR
jgi:hypothetical protein